MNRDGDILGTRRRPEQTPSAALAGLGITRGPTGETTAADDALPGESTSSSAARLAGGTGLTPLKRQRSGGVGSSATAGGNENQVEGAAGEVPVDKLTPAQLRRFQAWKRSRLDRASVRELVLDRAAPTLTAMLKRGQGTGALKETSTLAVAAMAKMYVGDLVEEAKREQLHRGKEGPLRPSDLLEARERLAARGFGPPLRASSARVSGLTGAGGSSAGRSLLGGGVTLTKGDAL